MTRGLLTQRYLDLLWRWSWIFILATLVAGGTAYLVVKDKPPIYEAETRLLIGPGIDAPNPDLNALRAGGQLMQTYAELSSTGPFLQKIIDELSLEYTTDELGGMISAKTNQETQILRIIVQNEDPKRAIAIANLAAELLVRMSPSGSESPTALLNEQMRNQVDRLEGIIANSEATIEGLEGDLKTLADRESQGLIVLQTDNYLEKQRLIVEQISQERGRLSDALSALTLLYESLQKNPTNQVKIVESAVSSQQVVSRLRLSILLAGLAGLSITIVIALVFEYMDDTIKGSEELSQLGDIPLLGTIAEGNNQTGKDFGSFVFKSSFPSEIGESYRLLGTKLIRQISLRSPGKPDLANTSDNSESENASSYNKVHSLVIGSSPSNHDGSVIASNLAVVLSRFGLKVILIDANPKGVSIGKLFKIEDKLGLGEILSDLSIDPESALVDWSTNLSIVPIGQFANNSFDLLSSPRMEEIIKLYRTKADIVLIGSPSLSTYADALILASMVDGVVIGIRKDVTRRSMLDDLLSSLETFDVNVIGTVLEIERSSRFAFPRIPNVGKDSPNPDRKPILFAILEKRHVRQSRSSTFSSRIDPAVAEANNSGKVDATVLGHKLNENRGHEAFPLQASKS
jgi:capsular polysaccharide biosynthesis protein/Mrp family chromosome partitioning ATPase